MNREEFMAKLQMVYVGDRNAFDEIVGVYDELKKQIHKASIEIQSLIEQDIDCPSNCNKLQELHKKNENQRQELRSLNERLKELKKSNGYLKQENQRLKKDIKIKEGLHETTFKNLMEERKENQRLNNVLNELKWKSIEEYDRKKYDWVLVKYHLEDNYECIPCVAEMRYDGFWYDRDDNMIDYDVDYFFDMQILDELKGSDK